MERRATDRNCGEKPLSVKGPPQSGSSAHHDAMDRGTLSPCDHGDRVPFSLRLGGWIYSVGNPRAPTKDPTRTNPAIDSASIVTDLKSVTLDGFDDVQVLLSVDLAQQSEIHSPTTPAKSPPLCGRWFPERSQKDDQPASRTMGNMNSEWRYMAILRKNNRRVEMAARVCNDIPSSTLR